jgi:glutamate 5-kinase
MSEQPVNTRATGASASHANGNGARPVKRVVVKLGTNLITGRGKGIDEATLEGLVAQVAATCRAGTEALVVTSGAVGAGREVLSKTSSPEKLQQRTVAHRQALAALGQTQLMLTYERLFDKHGIQVAQALISRGDLTRRLGYLNVRNTLEALLEIGSVPVINENDVVAVEELTGVVYGDNDRLSAMVANAVDADLLILLGEMEGLFEADPHLDPDAKIIPEVTRITPEIKRVARGPHDGRGSGGMSSKLEAAELATSSGTPMVIASGRTPDVITRICAGERLGTLFTANISKVEARKRWMMTGITDNHGWVSVDDGAAEVLQKRGVSLLPAGITAVAGDFERGDIIGIKDRSGRVVAWGLANYTSRDLVQIKGRRTADVQAVLGHYFGPEVVHRNNMALM